MSFPFFVNFHVLLHLPSNHDQRQGYYNYCWELSKSLKRNHDGRTAGSEKNIDSWSRPRDLISGFWPWTISISYPYISRENMISFFSEVPYISPKRLVWLGVRTLTLTPNLDLPFFSNLELYTLVSKWWHQYALRWRCASGMRLMVS